MPLLDLTKITSGLSKVWSGYLRDWDRSLRSGNYPETTRYNYLLAAAQLAGYLGEYSPDPDADGAAEDPTEVTKAHVEAFQAWMIETRSASTALNKHKGLQQFFKWLLLDEEAIDRSPMDRIRQPKTPTKLIPIIRDDDTKKVIGTCRGKTFIQLRDEAIIRLYYNTGARLSEVGNLDLDDVDLTTDSVHYHGKGARDRRVRFGPKTARALSRYLRARDKHNGAHLPNLWLADRGARPLAPNGIKIMLKRRGLAAGLSKVHAHRWRHNFAHEWKLAGGDTATSCSCSVGPPMTCPATTAPAPPPNARRKPSFGWGSVSMSNRDLSDPNTIVRVVTVIMGAVVGLTFLFGFGNVFNLALRLGVPPWVAPLVAPAVDLSVIGLLLGTRYLAISGASPEQLRPARRLLIFSSLVALALNVAEPIIAGQYGKAAFDAVGPLLLIGWAEVGPGLLAALACVTNPVPTRNPAPHGEICDREDRGEEEGAVLTQTGIHVDPPARCAPDMDLLNRARLEDAHHWQVHRRPISSDTLRKRLHIGAGKARDLVGLVRSEYQIQGDDRSLGTRSLGGAWVGVA